MKAELSLADRVFRCAACGLRIDRDLNAAINLALLDETHMTVNTVPPGVTPWQDVEPSRRPTPCQRDAGEAMTRGPPSRKTPPPDDRAHSRVLIGKQRYAIVIMAA